MAPNLKMLQDKLSELADRHRVPGAAIGVMRDAADRAQQLIG